MFETALGILLVIMERTQVVEIVVDRVFDRVWPPSVLLPPSPGGGAGGRGPVPIDDGYLLAPPPESIMLLSGAAEPRMPVLGLMLDHAGAAEPPTGTAEWFAVPYERQIMVEPPSNAVGMVVALLDANTGDGDQPRMTLTHIEQVGTDRGTEVLLIG